MKIGPWPNRGTSIETIRFYEREVCSRRRAYRQLPCTCRRTSAVPSSGSARNLGDARRDSRLDRAAGCPAQDCGEIERRRRAHRACDAAHPRTSRAGEKPQGIAPAAPYQCGCRMRHPERLDNTAVAGPPVGFMCTARNEAFCGTGPPPFTSIAVVCSGLPRRKPADPVSGFEITLAKVQAIFVRR